METNNLKVIYKILNKINNKFYIGSTVNHKKRISEHKRALNKNRHHNSILQNAWNKYGKDSFEFIIIEHVEQREQLLKREQYYLDNLKPEYNIATNSSAPMLGKKHSKESIEKILLDLNSRPKGKDHPNYGRRWTEE